MRSRELPHVERAAARGFRFGNSNQCRGRSALLAYGRSLAFARKLNLLGRRGCPAFGRLRTVAAESSRIFRGARRGQETPGGIPRRRSGKHGSAIMYVCQARRGPPSSLGACRFARSPPSTVRAPPANASPIGATFPYLAAEPNKVRRRIGASYPLIAGLFWRARKDFEPPAPRFVVWCSPLFRPTLICGPFPKSSDQSAVALSGA